MTAIAATDVLDLADLIDVSSLVPPVPAPAPITRQVSDLTPDVTGDRVVLACVGHDRPLMDLDATDAATLISMIAGCLAAITARAGGAS